MSNAICSQYDSLKAAGVKKNKKKRLGLFMVKLCTALSDPGSRQPHQDRCPYQPTDIQRFRLQTKLQKKRKLYGSTPAALT